MKNIMQAVQRDWADEWLRLQVGAHTHWAALNAPTRIRRRMKGATMVEYGIMVALIAAISIGVIATIGTSIFDAFTAVDTAL